MVYQSLIRMKLQSFNSWTVLFCNLGKQTNSSKGCREAYGLKHKVAGFIFCACIFHRNTWNVNKGREILQLLQINLLWVGSRTVSYFQINISSSLLAWKQLAGRMDNRFSSHRDVGAFFFFFKKKSFYHLFSLGAITKGSCPEVDPSSPARGAHQHSPAAPRLAAVTKPPPFQPILVKWAFGMLPELAQDLDPKGRGCPSPCASSRFCSPCWEPPTPNISAIRLMERPPPDGWFLYFALYITHLTLFFWIFLPLQSQEAPWHSHQAKGM